MNGRPCYQTAVLTAGCNLSVNQSVLVSCCEISESLAKSPTVCAIRYGPYLKQSETHAIYFTRNPTSIIIEYDISKYVFEWDLFCFIEFISQDVGNYHILVWWYFYIKWCFSWFHLVAYLISPTWFWMIRDKSRSIDEICTRYQSTWLEKLPYRQIQRVRTYSYHKDTDSLPNLWTPEVI